MNKFLLFLFAGVFGCSVALGNGLDSNAQESLQETQKILTNPMLRNKSVQDLNTPASKDALNNAHKLGDATGQTEALFQLSSQVFEQMVKESNGDSAKLEKMMPEAQKNPEKFFNSWSPEQKAKVSEIANKIENKKAVP